MGEIKDGGPAFPHDNQELGDKHRIAQPGMTLRDWLAGQVACGMAAFSGTAGVSYGPGDIAGRSYEVADAMIAEGCEGGVNPLQAELDEAKKHIAYLESLRPHWAKGFSSDSVAAQCSTDALNSLWKLLGATNQTEAVERVKEMLRAREGGSND